MHSVVELRLLVKNASHAPEDEKTAVKPMQYISTSTSAKCRDVLRLSLKSLSTMNLKKTLSLSTLYKTV